MSLIPFHPQPNRLYSYEVEQVYVRRNDKWHLLGPNDLPVNQFEHDSMTITFMRFNLPNVLDPNKWDDLHLNDIHKRLTIANARDLHLLSFYLRRVPLTTDLIKSCSSDQDLIDIVGKKTILNKLQLVIEETFPERRLNQIPKCIIHPDCEDTSPPLPIHFISSLLYHHILQHTCGSIDRKVVEQCMTERKCLRTYRWNNRDDIVPFRFSEPHIVPSSHPTSTKKTSTQPISVLQMVVIQPKDQYLRMWMHPTCPLQETMEWQVKTVPVLTNLRTDVGNDEIYLENYELLGLAIKDNNI